MAVFRKHDIAKPSLTACLSLHWKGVKSSHFSSTLKPSTHTERGQWWVLTSFPHNTHSLPSINLWSLTLSDSRQWVVVISVIWCKEHTLCLCAQSSRPSQKLKELGLFEVCTTSISFRHPQDSPWVDVISAQWTSVHPLISEHQPWSETVSLSHWAAGLGDFCRIF